MPPLTIAIALLIRRQPAIYGQFQPAAPLLLHPEATSAQYADAANSSYVDVNGAEALKLQWSRSVKGELAAQVALGSTGATNYLAANAQTPAGCSLMVWENDNNGRQRWCTRLWPGGGFAAPL